MKIVNEYWLEDDKGKKIELSPREVKIVKVLLDYNFISYRKICNILYNCELDDSYMSAITLFISRMNKKIKDIITIKNRRKIGYYVKK